MKSLNIMRIIKSYIYIFTFITCSLLTIFFIYNLLFYTAEVNPVKLKKDLNSNVFTFVPQGWAFFTRSPREAQIILYQKDSNQDYLEISQRHTSYKNSFGLNRQASKIMAELQFIKREVNDSLYINTEWNYQSNILGEIPKNSIVVKNQFKNPILCGEYVIVFQKAVPWAWSRNIEKIKMPSKVIKLTIECFDDKKNK